MFDPEQFGEAMGLAIREAVAPLHERIKQLESAIEKARTEAFEDLRKGLAAIPEVRHGKDCDMQAVQAMVEKAVSAVPAPKDGARGNDGESITLTEVQPILDEAIKSMKAAAEMTLQDVIKAIPSPQNGKDGTNGADGKSITADDVRPILAEAIESLREQANAVVDAAVKAIPTPKDGANGKDGADGKKGESGADGLGLAGAMIDRDGALQITLTNGEAKNLGPVVGKDGADGKDGLSFESFEMEYLAESHEVSVKATAAGRAKELRYPAGGIRPAGYWRDGTKAQAGEAWVHDGSLWIAMKSTPAKPESRSEDWIIAARKGRDGERGQKGADATPVAPISLKA